MERFYTCRADSPGFCLIRTRFAGPCRDSIRSRDEPCPPVCVGGVTSSGSRCKRDRKSSCHLNRRGASERASVSCCQGGWRSKGRGRASNHHEPHPPLSLQTSHEAAGSGQHVQSGPQVHLSPGTEQECGNASEKGGRARRGRFMTNRMHSCPCKPCKTLQSTCVGRNSEWESCWEITRVRAQRRMGHPRRIGNTPLEKQRPIVSYG